MRYVGPSQRDGAHPQDRRTATGHEHGCMFGLFLVHVDLTRQQTGLDPLRFKTQLAKFNLRVQLFLVGCMHVTDQVGDAADDGADDGQAHTNPFKLRFSHPSRNLCCVLFLVAMSR